MALGRAFMSSRDQGAARLRAALVEHASDVILVVTVDGTIHYVNPACRRVLGYPWKAGDVVNVLSFIHPDDRDGCRSRIRESYDRPGEQPLDEFRIAHADGSWRRVQSIGNNLLHDPAVSGFVVTLRDVTEQRESEMRLLANARRQSALVELGRWALVGLDYSSLLEDAVKVLADQLVVDIVHVLESYDDPPILTVAASKGQMASGSELVWSEPTSSPASFALFTQEAVISEDLREEDRFDVPELWTRAAAVSVVEVPIPGPDAPIGVVGVGSHRPRSFSDEDVNFVKSVANVLAAAGARALAESAIRAQALLDPLTGLPNRLLLAAHGTTALAPASSKRRLSGNDRTVFVFGIDRFKEINDTLGHVIGDRVLIAVARRLEAIGDPIEVLARLGGDEFAVVCRTFGSNEDEREFADRLLAVVGDPLHVEGINLRLRASVGISTLEPGRHLDVPDLLRRAETGMYQAKAAHTRIGRYADDTEGSSLARLTLASELAEAIDQGQLRIDYQPKISTNGWRAIGLEALVRWQHPTRGLLLPDIFVPIAEQTGIIQELTHWVLGRALAECASWQRAGWDLPVAVNLSAGTVHDPALLQAVMSAISRSGLAPESVELEITESAVMLDPDGAMQRLHALTAQGVHLSLDDFGTGYSSLAYLQKLPVTSVKIDKSFVTSLCTDTVAQSIVKAVVDLGHSLKMSVIAEGVDSAEVLQVLAGLGCDAIQGFHLAMPMDPPALRRWLQSEAGGNRQTEQPPGTELDPSA
ncbi:MAG: sensor domain-containing protein [Acidimicrobiales bacterium]